MKHFDGRCLCGDVRFSAQPPSLWVAHCHCTMCQRNGGAAFITWVGFDETRCRIEDSLGRLSWYHSSDQGERGFCSRCGSTLFFRSKRWPGELHVTLANLTEAIDRAPQAHVFWDTHVEWVQLADDDGLPRKSEAEMAQD